MLNFHSIAYRVKFDYQNFEVNLLKTKLFYPCIYFALYLSHTMGYGREICIKMITKDTGFMYYS